MQFPPPDGPGFEIPSVVEELWCEFLAWKTGGSGGRTDSLFVMVFLGVIEIKVVILLCTLSKSIMIHIFIYIYTYCFKHPVSFGIFQGFCGDAL